MAHPGLPEGAARPCAARNAALAGWEPRAAPAGPPEPVLHLTVLAFSTRCCRRGGRMLPPGAASASRASRRSWFKMAPNYSTTIIHYCHNALLQLTRRPSASWFKVAPTLYEGTSLWPTPAFLEARRAPAQPGAQPWLAGSLVRRQLARPNPSSTGRSSRFRPGALPTK